MVKCTDRMTYYMDGRAINKETKMWKDMEMYKKHHGLYYWIAGSSLGNTNLTRYKTKGEIKTHSEGYV